MPKSGSIDGELHLRPGEGVAVEEPAIVKRTAFTAQTTVEHEKVVGDGGETVPGTTLHNVSLIIVLNHRPVHLLHIEDVHVVHSLGAISTTEDKDSSAETGGGMGCACNGHVAGYHRPLPLVALRIVTDELVVPSARIMLQKRKRLVTFSLKRSQTYPRRAMIEDKDVSDVDTPLSRIAPASVTTKEPKLVVVLPANALSKQVK